jgi:DNA-directed RNA polymerase subunit RPC12/RpoP
VKFSCERCGKKYATAEDPAPGRVYKLKCKACGHLIVVKASTLAASPPEAAPAGATPTEPQPLPPPLESSTPEPAEIPGNGSAHAAGSPHEGTEVPSAATAAPPEPEASPPEGSGYVDLFSDAASGASELPLKPSDDAYADAAPGCSSEPAQPPS